MESSVRACAQSYVHEGRHLDVFEEIQVISTTADLFAGQRTAAGSTAPQDTCRPAGYGHPRTRNVYIPSCHDLTMSSRTRICEVEVGTC